jgi:alkyl hydroperoxide reductase subunit AhpF
MTTHTGEQAREQIRQWGDRCQGDITLRYATTGHAMDEAIKQFAEQVAELAPCVQVRKDGDAVVSLPALLVGRQVVYQALPLERELAPFLAFLNDNQAFAGTIAADVRQRLKQLRVPALVRVYITPHCPFCPLTVSTLLGLAAHSDQVRITVIDGERFPESAEKDRVSAAPTVILDDQLRWTGNVDAGELVTLMLDRDPASLGADALRSMIEEGNAEGVAAMMATRGKLFDGFIDLLCHPRWSVRLGAMVAFETLVEQDPALAGAVVEPVTAVFADADDMVKGDLLHVLGESGNRSVLPFLSSVTDGRYDDEVRSAALEAIEKLE